jgi:type II secretory pathway pseudopilin PulG
MLKLKNQHYKNDELSKSRTDNAIMGFTMVEIIVALTILSTSLIALFGTLQICTTAVHHTRMLTNSVLLAEKLFTETKLNQNLAFETRQGRHDIYQWKVQTVPTPIEYLGAVSVQVKWKEQKRQQQYELISLIYIQPVFEGG